MPITTVTAPLQSLVTDPETGRMSIPWALWASQFAEWRKDLDSLYALIATHRHSLPASVERLGFSVHLNGVNQLAVPDNIFTRVAFTTAIWNDATKFDLITNFRWVPGRIGRAYFTGKVRWNTMVTGVLLATAIFKNGVIYKQNEAVSNTTIAQGVAISAIVDVTAATDYFELFAYQNTGAAKDINGSALYTWWMGMMLPDRALPL